MKRTMALAALTSVVALFAFTTQAAAQDGPTASVDPEYVSEAGTHTITVSGSGWPAAGTVILACAGFGGVEPEVVEEADAFTKCDIGGLTPATMDGDSFSNAVDLDIPAEGLVILVGNQAAGLGVLATVHVGEMMADDMADEGGTDTDMAPEGGADTGFGGMAGSDGNSVAVPLAASIAAVVVLGGATLVRRRNA